MHGTQSSLRLTAPFLPAPGLLSHHQAVTTPWHWSALERPADVIFSGSVPMTSTMEASGNRKGCQRSRLSRCDAQCLLKNPELRFKGYFPQKPRLERHIEGRAAIPTLYKNQAGISTGHTERGRAPLMFHLALSVAREQIQF